jgi:hypothetical protein
VLKQCWIKSSFVDLDGWQNGWFWFGLVWFGLVWFGFKGRLNKKIS